MNSSVTGGSAAEGKPPRLSTVTRLLCVGAHVDPQFTRAVINVLVNGAQRFVAPSYGYDVLPVIGHALHARDRRRRRQWVIGGSFGVMLVLDYLLPPMILVLSFFLWLWLTWAVNFVNRLLVLSVLTNHLQSPERAAPGKTFTGAIPEHPDLLPHEITRITEEQDAASNLVYYGGYRPFVGAGEWVRSDAFPIMLNGAPVGPSINGDPVALKPIRQFGADDMLEYVTRRLRAVLQTDEVVGRSISDLDIRRRGYRTAVDRRRPDPRLSGAAPQDYGYDASREYLCIRVGTWDQELVSSTFVNFDVRGSTLYTEIHSYLLHPLRRGYHQADRLSSEISTPDMWKLALYALGDMIGSAVAAVVYLVTLPFQVFALMRGRTGGRTPAEYVDPQLEIPVTRHAVSDFGALHSVRELASIRGHHHFFQEVDAAKYAEIVERRLLEIAIDFLASRDVDTSEYRAKQMAILNYGIMQTGNGVISNVGTMAVGTGATASGK